MKKLCLFLFSQLRREFGTVSLPPFPPKKFLSLSPNQLEERRLLLERYIQVSKYMLTALKSSPSFAGGGGGAREDRTTPSVTIKLKIYPSNIFQNPPYCTNLQLKIKKKFRGMTPDPPPLTCIFHSLSAKYQFKQYFTGGLINLLRKHPSNLKITSPLQKFLGLGLLKYIYLYKPWRPKGLFQFDIILNEDLCSTAIINISYFLRVGIDFRRQNLMSIDVRFWRLNVVLY